MDIDEEVAVASDTIPAEDTVANPELESDSGPQVGDSAEVVPPLQENDEADRSNEDRLNVILDIPVRLSMEVGNTAVSIGKLMKLSRGSVIELDRAAGEPLDVLVNGTLIAHGEVVVINDKFGIRLTDVVSPQERIKKLN